MLKLFKSSYQAPFGTITLIFNGNLEVYGLYFTNDSHIEYFNKYIGENNFEIIEADLAKELKQKLDDYFSGNIYALKDIKTKVFGTEFQIRAWEALKKIEPATTISYQSQARSLGNSRAVRAIGGANNKNPIAIIIPCHRVIGKNGSMVGFGGGIKTKEFLIEHEKRNAKNN